MLYYHTFFDIVEKFTMNLIFAIDRSGCIGKGGSLPWHIPADLKFFKGKTQCSAVVMGYGTWESFNGFVLPNRDCYVLSGRQIDLPENVTQLHSLGEVFALSASIEKTVFIIGGANLYNQLLEFATNIYVTYVDCLVEDGDTYIDMDKLANAVSGSEKISDETLVDEASGLTVRFVHYQKNED